MGDEGVGGAKRGREEREEGGGELRENNWDK